MIVISDWRLQDRAGAIRSAESQTAQRVAAESFRVLAAMRRAVRNDPQTIGATADDNDW
jgi:hypothetical protein